MGPNRPPYSPPAGRSAPGWGVHPTMGVVALRMALRPSERNQASQGLLNRGFRPFSVEHLFGIDESHHDHPPMDPTDMADLEELEQCRALSDQEDQRYEEYER